MLLLNANSVAHITENKSLVEVMNDLAQAINADPGNRELWFVYADWLEEHGNTLMAAFIREIDETLLSTVTSDFGRAVCIFYPKQPYMLFYYHEAGLIKVHNKQWQTVEENIYISRSKQCWTWLHTYLNDKGYL